MSALLIQRSWPGYTEKNADNFIRTRAVPKKKPNYSIPLSPNIKNLNRTQDAAFSAKKSLMTGSNLRVRLRLKKILKFRIFI
nr:TPA: ALTO [Baja California bark scorpion polyomavirus 1]